MPQDTGGRNYDAVWIERDAGFLSGPERWGLGDVASLLSLRTLEQDLDE